VTRHEADRALCAAIAAGSAIAAIALAISERPERSVPLFVAAAGSIVALLAPAPAIPRSLFAGAVTLDASLTAGGVFDSFNRGDHVGHFVLTGLLVALLASVVAVGQTPASRVLSLVAAGVAAGFCWELLELAFDSLLGTDMSLGLRDSALDLVADLAGAAVAALLLVRYGSIGRDPRRTSPL
jgi:hypothetical protein